MSVTGQARDQHTRALAIARDLGAPLEEARALEGIGNSRFQDANARQGAVHLLQALAIYERIGAPAARRVQETLQRRGLPSTTPQPQPATPSEGHGRARPPHPQKAVRQAAAQGHAPSWECGRIA
jgi:hypothetical protein